MQGLPFQEEVLGMMKAIETSFDGRLFRSRAEARWAAFFKGLGLIYEYECEGFILPSGVWYLPDFRLHLKSHGTVTPLWIEIKPNEQNNDGKLDAFGVALPAEHRATLLPSLEAYTWGRNGVECLFGGDRGEDYPFFFCVCQHCGEVGFEFDGRAERLDCCTKNVGDKNYQYENPKILRAINYALSERFGR